MIPGSEPGGIYHFPSQARGVAIPAGIQDKDGNCSASYGSSQGRERAHPVLPSLLEGSPCCAQQEFHCGHQRLGRGFAPKCICLFLYRKCFAAYCLRTSHLRSPPRPGPHQLLSIWKLVMLHQLRAVFWIF